LESKTMVWVVFALVMSVGAGSTVWGENLSDVENVIISVDGVEPTVENISSGSYALDRDLILVNKGELSAPASDFLNWILSEDGQSVVADSGFVPIEAEERVISATSGTVNVAGSTTVLPLMVKLVEVYEKSTNITVNVMGGGSGKGINDVKCDNADLGMLSRDLNSDDPSLNVTKIAGDGVVILVDKSSGITNLSIEQIARIFNGEITNWADVGGNDLRISPIVRETISGTRSTLDNAISEELGISLKNVIMNLNCYPSTNSTGAMLSNIGSSIGAIGYINMYAANNL
jgi:ABC-type phosphate transport system substrate-binding protein